MATLLTEDLFAQMSDLVERATKEMIDLQFQETAEKLKLLRRGTGKTFNSNGIRFPISSPSDEDIHPWLYDFRIHLQILRREMDFPPRQCYIRRVDKFGGFKETITCSKCIETEKQREQFKFERKKILLQELKEKREGK